MNVPAQNILRNRCRYSSSQPAEHRNGSAVVELVIALPLLFLVVFGSIEACNMNHIQQCATEASYHGALIGLSSGATEADMTAGMSNMLTARGITGGTFTVIGADGLTAFDTLVSGDLFVVTTNIPIEGNLTISGIVGNLPEFGSTRTAMKP